MKTSLVLEGGAMRGMYTVGVLDVLMEHNIQVDMIVGVSAGALFGVNYLSKQPGRALRYSKKFNRLRGYLGIIPLLREGNIVNTDYAYNKIPREWDPFDDDTFQASNVPFYAVVTNMRTGQAEYKQISSGFEQIDTLKASGSMPFVSRPVELDGELYLDGAVGDSIPYAWSITSGYEKNIVILTREANYVRKPYASIILKKYQKTYPKFAEQLASHHIRYDEQLEKLKQLEAEGKAFVIRPSKPITIGRIEKNPDRLQEVYELGVADGLACIEALKQYMGEE